MYSGDEALAVAFHTCAGCCRCWSAALVIAPEALLGVLLGCSVGLSREERTEGTAPRSSLNWDCLAVVVGEGAWGLCTLLRLSSAALACRLQQRQQHQTHFSHHHQVVTPALCIFLTHCAVWGCVSSTLSHSHLGLQCTCYCSRTAVQLRRTATTAVYCTHMTAKCSSDCKQQCDVTLDHIQ